MKYIAQGSKKEVELFLQQLCLLNDADMNYVLCEYGEHDGQLYIVAATQIEAQAAKLARLDYQFTASIASMAQLCAARLEILE